MPRFFLFRQVRGPAVQTRQRRLRIRRVCGSTSLVGGGILIAVSAMAPPIGYERAATTTIVAIRLVPLLIDDRTGFEKSVLFNVWPFSGKIGNNVNQMKSDT
jgi:hypothetical protein